MTKFDKFFMLFLTVAIIAIVLLLQSDNSDGHSRERSTYGTCYSLRGTMANGKQVHRGAVASNVLRLGTRIRLTHRTFYGRRRFVVSDTGSALWDGHLDFWHPSYSKCIQWGKRPVKYRVVRR